MSIYQPEVGRQYYAVWTYSGDLNLPPIILYWGRTAPEKHISLYTAFSPSVLMIKCASLTTREMTQFCEVLELSQYEFCPENSNVSRSMMLSLNQPGIDSLCPTN